MTVDLQDLFDQAGMNPPTGTVDVDDVLRRARRSRNRRRTSGAVVATVVVTLALVVGVASQRRPSANPVPAVPVPTTQVLGSLGRLAYGINGDIYVAEADGRNPVRIADGAPPKADRCGGYWGEGPIWSPNGRYLAYRGSVAEAKTTPPCDRTVNISDSAGHRVASFPGDGWAIAWSPDSTRVAVWADFNEAQLAIHGLDGVRQALLAMPPDWNRVGDVDPLWSSDGASLLVPGGAEIPVDGSPPRQLALDDPRSQAARYSPSRAEIAYVSPDGLFIAAADGSRARKLIPAGRRGFDVWTSALVWSPTGDRIAFAVDEVAELQESRFSSELAVLDVASGRVLSLDGMP